jgi:hypothetical protein
MDNIRAIRRKIDAKTKNMTTTERTAYFNASGEASAKKYGFVLVDYAHNDPRIPLPTKDSTI